MFADKANSVQEICITLGISRATLDRYVNVLADVPEASDLNATGMNQVDTIAVCRSTCVTRLDTGEFSIDIPILLFLIASYEF
jgi:hypothetical protein